MFAHGMLFIIFLIFFGAVVLSTIAILTGQSMLVAYILLGLLLGPYGAKLVPNVKAFAGMGEVGIIFLLFLVGLNLDPRDLYQSLKKVSLVTLGASLILAAISILIAYCLHYPLIDSVVVGLAMIFSSTVIDLKLMSKRELFNSARGELMIGILLLQDLLAMVALFVIEGLSKHASLGFSHLFSVSMSLPLLLIGAFLGKRLIIKPLVQYFWHVKEYVFLLTIVWCLGLAELGAYFGLNVGIGAFIGGVSIASNSNLAILIRRRLNPLRDFFLVLFFFALGAEFNYRLIDTILLPAILFCLLLILLKPFIYAFLLRSQKVSQADSWEVGFRLGQASEFSLLIAALAANVTPRLISLRTEYTIELMTLLSFILSCYYVVRRYPTPMRRKEK